MLYIAAALSFLIGSIPFAVILVRGSGIDVRKIGSGNPGFVNSVRAVGIRRALPVLVADIGKGWCAAYLALVLGGGWWVALLAVAGHCFSPWLHFKGGKGVATFIGVALFASPLVGAVSILAWLFVFGLFRIASLASFVCIICILTGIWWLMPTAVAAFAAAALLIILRHPKNISRLIRGTELGITF